jgi:hypothetical protein
MVQGVSSEDFSHVNPKVNHRYHSLLATMLRKFCSVHGDHVSLFLIGALTDRKTESGRAVLLNFKIFVLGT